MTGTGIVGEIEGALPVVEGVATVIPGAGPYIAAAEAATPAVEAVADEVQALVTAHAGTVGTVNAILAFLTRLFPGHNVPPAI